MSHSNSIGKSTAKILALKRSKQTVEELPDDVPIQLPLDDGDPAQAASSTQLVAFIHHLKPSSNSNVDRNKTALENDAWALHKARIDFTSSPHSVMSFLAI